MKAIGIVLAVLVGGFALIMAIGAAQPETEATRASDQCYTLNKMAYTPAEKAQAAEICAMLRKEADRRMGRLPAGTP